MRVLAFDTTAAACAVALWADGRVEAAEAVAMDRGQAEALAPMIDTVMDRAGQPLSAIDRIAVTTGPGSFTGVRVGLATARGLGLALSVPVLGIAASEVIAHAAPNRNDRPVAVVIDAKRKDVYLHLFGPDLTEAAPPAAIAPAGVIAALPAGPVLVTGDGVHLVANTLNPACQEIAQGPSLADPAILAALAATRAPADAEPTPLYVRPPDAALPKDGGRLRP